MKLMKIQTVNNPCFILTCTLPRLLFVAEEWYTNDYPEEEESDLSQDDDNGSFNFHFCYNVYRLMVFIADEFHEDTIDSDSEHEWR